MRVPAAVLAAVLLAAGCADDADESASASASAPDAAPSASPTVSASAPAAAFPATISHRYGSTTITEPPERVVVAGLVEQDILLALGIVPVATTEWYGEQPGAIFPWATDELGDAELPEVLSFIDGIQVEAIAAQQPDLILGLYSGMTEGDYDRLTAIAPTVAQPTDVDYEVEWQSATRTVGKAVGREADADAMVREVEDLFAQARADHPEFAGLSALLATPFEGYGVYSSADPRSEIMADLGFGFPAELDEIVGESFFANLSRERLDLLDQDVLVWYIEAPEQITGILTDELYANLAVTDEGRDVFLDDENDIYNSFQFSSVLSLPGLITGLVPLLSAAVDGDPGTEVEDDRGDAS